MTTVPYTTVDLKNLSEAELEIVVQVIQKDFELKAAETARLRRHRRQLKEYDKRVSILASSNFNERFCVICFQRFYFLIIPKRCCYSCRHSMCTPCSVWIPVLKAYICLLCQKERNLKSMGCDWYYGLLKSRFQQDGSEVVAQSLYNNQGQYNFVHIFYRKICYSFKPEWMKFLKHSETEDSIITPDLLKKVKGAQISRYRQKIHARWEDMQERLNQLDQSDIAKSKKDEEWHSLTEEYKNYFKDILKEFSQFLYITLENYAAKVEDPDLNINEQVITTVYDEVELMIGYRINYMPDDMGSMLSDVESTASMFIGNQMEDKLANALVNKIIQDHSLSELQNYDIKCLDNFQPDDESSTISYLYRAKPYNSNPVNGTMSGRSSAAASSMIEQEPSIELHKYNSMQYGMQSRMHNEDSLSTLDGINESTDVILSIEEVQNILRYSSSGRKSSKQIIERTINVLCGEPLKLQFQLNGLTDIKIIWYKSYKGRTMPLNNDNNIEINESISNNLTTYLLTLWQTTENDIGLYTAMISDHPIVEFTVNIIANNNKLMKPMFRLKMLNCNCRTGQVGEFSVEALGYPEPRITFYHNNQVIEISQDKYKIDFKEQISRCTLRILNITEKDHGTYKCLATNSSGSCECSAQLQVTNVKFRFDKKIARSHSSSNSSIDENVFQFPPSRTNSVNDNPRSANSVNDGPLNELVEIHQHLMYLEWQLDWFEEQSNQDSIKSPNNTKQAIAYKPSQSPSIVIGREFPDEFKVRENQKSSPLPRTVHSYSTENFDSVDNDTALAREEAIKSSGHSLNNSNTNINKLKQIFDQPEIPHVHRNASITARTPRFIPRKSQSSFTNEIRVANKDSAK